MTRHFASLESPSRSPMAIDQDTDAGIAMSPSSLKKRILFESPGMAHVGPLNPFPSPF